jgi:Ca2+/H+ antiporter
VSHLEPHPTHPTHQALHPYPGVWWSFVMLVVCVIVVIPVNSYLVENKDKRTKNYVCLKTPFVDVVMVAIIVVVVVIRLTISIIDGYQETKVMKNIYLLAK